MLSKCHWHCH